MPVEFGWITVDGSKPPRWDRPTADPISLMIWAALHRNWSPLKYERDVLDVWNSILMGRGDTPRVLFKHFGEKHITIVPGAPRHAAARPLSTLNATARGRPERICGGDYSGQFLMNYQFGTGFGSDVEISFTPDDWIGKSRPGEAADEVLFHELVHAFRETTGKEQCRSAEGDMDTEEEVIAIAITNMYSSERGRPLRRDHHSLAKLVDPDGWIEQHRLPLKRFCNSQRAVAHELALLPAPFNPFEKLSPVRIHRR